MTNPPNTNWPIGTRVQLLDAYGRNPIEGRVTAHYGLEKIRVEDDHRIVYTGDTWRVRPPEDDWSYLV